MLTRIGGSEPDHPHPARTRGALHHHRGGTELLIVRPQWRAFDYEALANSVAADVGFRVLATETLPTGDPATLPPPPGPEPTARWLYYTSGSTSDPKGAWHTDPSVTAGANAWLTKLRPTADDVYPVAFPVAHIGGVCMLAVALVTGMRLVLIEAFDAERTPFFMAEQGEDVARHRAADVPGVPRRGTRPR